jgi:hypothetical protein
MVKEGTPRPKTLTPITFYRKVNKLIPLNSRAFRESDRKASG